MIMSRNTDSRNPSKILYICDPAQANFTFESHFRGSLVGLQVSSSAVPGGTYTITVTDTTSGSVLLATGTVTPSGTPYFHEFLATGVQYLPAPDSQLGSLPVINQNDILTVAASANLVSASAVITLEFQGQ